MRAVRIHEAGGPEVLRYEEVATPQPGPGEVLVQLRAAALNRRDIWIRTGRQGTAFFPCIPGSDGAACNDLHSHRPTYLSLPAAVAAPQLPTSRAKPSRQQLSALLSGQE